MKISWLNRKNNQNLIVFFNGWGMDDEIVTHLDSSGFDIITICDYRDFEFDYKSCDCDFEKYSEKYLICWSMGVYVSNLFKKLFDNFDKKIAVAGTNRIIDNNFGILEKIYNVTIKYFSDESAKKFIDNIFLNENHSFKIKRSTSELKDELISLKNLEIEHELNYNKAIIPTKDIIVPFRNQINYWESMNIKSIQINAPHYVFGKFKSWQEIIC